VTYNPATPYTDNRTSGISGENNMKATYQVQVGRRGVITFPKELRDQNNITDGEILNLIELSKNVFVISRRRSQVDKVANKLAQEWQDSGESLESMLTTLREIRTESHEKKP
jgi:bifunctional DNA-binding transcriptional regulator/antitoxin component of YhaV-PrlF toxin-antitoxin module